MIIRFRGWGNLLRGNTLWQIASSLCLGCAARDKCLDFLGKVEIKGVVVGFTSLLCLSLHALYCRF